MINKHSIYKFFAAVFCSRPFPDILKYWYHRLNFLTQKEDKQGESV